MSESAAISRGVPTLSLPAFVAEAGDRAVLAIR